MLWILRDGQGDATSLWLSALAAFVAAGVMEGLKLFLEGRRPDPTDTLIAAAAAALACFAATRLAHWPAAGVTRRDNPAAANWRARCLAGVIALTIAAFGVPEMRAPRRCSGSAHKSSSSYPAALRSLPVTETASRSRREPTSVTLAVWTKNHLTIRGVGGFAHISADGANAEGKAIWVIKGAKYGHRKRRVFGREGAQPQRRRDPPGRTGLAGAPLLLPP